MSQSPKCDQIKLLGHHYASIWYALSTSYGSPNNQGRHLTRIKLGDNCFRPFFVYNTLFGFPITEPNR